MLLYLLTHMHNAQINPDTHTPSVAADLLLLRRLVWGQRSRLSDPEAPGGGVTDERERWRGGGGGEEEREGEEERGRRERERRRGGGGNRWRGGETGYRVKE